MGLAPISHEEFRRPIAEGQAEGLFRDTDDVGLIGAHFEGAVKPCLELLALSRSNNLDLTLGERPELAVDRRQGPDRKAQAHQDDECGAATEDPRQPEGQGGPRGSITVQQRTEDVVSQMT